ncbi:MAG: hypothetical protein U0175_26755 [Caldilineaceae bacterium]
MSETERSVAETNEPGIYEIRLKGYLADRWTDWFEGLTIKWEENGTTLLTSTAIDQATLYGLLRKVRDLGLPLLLVMRVEHDQGTPP